MVRSLLLLVLTCLLVPVWAQTAPTLRGMVTLTAERGLFYTNLGTHEQINAGAEYMVMRGGAAIARARVVKVSFLDSIAQLYPENRNLRIVTGDVVVLNTNGPTPCYRSQSCRLANADLPWGEPNMDMRRENNDYAILLLVILIGTALD